jgi:hypothetical protein
LVVLGKQGRQRPSGRIDQVDRFNIGFLVGCGRHRHGRHEGPQRSHSVRFRGWLPAELHRGRIGRAAVGGWRGTGPTAGTGLHLGCESVFTAGFAAGHWQLTDTCGLIPVMLAVNVVAAPTLTVIRTLLPDLVWLVPPPDSVRVPLLSEDPAAVSVVSGSQLMDWVAVVITGTGCPLGCGAPAGALVGGAPGGLLAVVVRITVRVETGCCAVIAPPTVTVATAVPLGRPLAVRGCAVGRAGEWVGVRSGEDAGLMGVAVLPRPVALAGGAAGGAAAG